MNHRLISFVPFVYPFQNKNKNKKKFFLKVVTIGTKVRSVVYQRLIAQICILEQDTIGYKRYNF